MRLNTAIGVLLTICLIGIAVLPNAAAAAIQPRLALGSEHSCALIVTGSMKCWGSNGFGQLANGTLVTDPKTKKPLRYSLPNGGTTPIEVRNLAGIPEVLGAGSHHTCAALLNGITRCWGYNDYGQLGKDTGMVVSGKLVNVPCVNADAETQAICGINPTPVQNPGGVPTALAGGDGQSCGLFAGGVVKCWGGTDSYSTAVKQIQGLSRPATSIAVGSGHACALLDDGTVACWGNGGDGQIGRDDFYDSRTPIAVAGLGAGATQVSAGDFHSCALLQNGSIGCWGLDDLGQLGDGRTDTSATPVTVQGLSGTPTSIAAGGRHTCALIDGGTVQCWGSNREGQLGNETSAGCSGFRCSTSPVTVQGLTGTAIAVWSGGTHSCALLESGRVQCWGSNEFGQLGATTTTGCPLKDIPVDIPCSRVALTVPGINLLRPAPSVTLRPAALTNVRAGTFGFAQVTGATFNCSIDSAAPSPCGARFTTPALRDGSHTLVVTANSLGSESEQTTVTWKVDATAPVLRSRAKTVLRTRTTYRMAIDPDPSGIAKVEYSLSSRAPAANARNNAAQTAAFRNPITFAPKSPIRWIRLQDKAGNWSRWYAG